MMRLRQPAHNNQATTGDLPSDDQNTSLSKLNKQAHHSSTSPPASTSFSTISNMIVTSKKNYCLLLCLFLAVLNIIHFQGNVNTGSWTTASGFRATSGAEHYLLRWTIQRPKAVLLTRRQGRVSLAASSSSMAVPVRKPRSSKRLQYSTSRLVQNPDWGGLTIEFLPSDTAMREIRTKPKKRPPPTDDNDDGDYDSSYEDDDEISKYLLAYADDDALGEQEALLRDTNQTQCTRRPWHRTIHPTCNSFHETDMPDILMGDDDQDNKHNTMYIGGGSYRSVYLTTMYNEAPEDVVWKTTSLKHGIFAKTVGSFLMDGVVSAALTPNPRLANMYGFCAVSLWSEPVTGGDMGRFQPSKGGRCKQSTQMALDKANKKGRAHSFNDLTASEKLSWALKMAEAVAVLHNYEGGTIVHGDIALRQFLIDPKDQSVKLTDFNQAEALRRDENGNECMFHSQHSFGTHRPPEMYRSKHLGNEKTDIWGLGITFYSLLTGMGNFHDECNGKKNISKRVMSGEVPWIDPRWKTKSVAEARLVSIIQQCFTYDYKERIDINQVIQLLKDAQRAHEKAQRKQEKAQRKQKKAQ